MNAVKRNADEVENAGFAKFNNGQHLCVEVPDGHSTISAKLSDGRQVTFAFVPYKENGVPRCVDIHDNGGKPLPDFVNKGQTCHAHRVICFSGGGPDPFRSSNDDEKPVTLLTLLMEETE